MRTIDATLKSALATGSFDFFAKLLIYYNGNLASTLDVKSYKLSGTQLEVSAFGLVPASNTPDQVKLILKRGVKISGTDYYLSTGKYSPNTGKIDVGDNVGVMLSTVQAHIIPRKRVSFAGDVSYRTLITSLCTAIGKTPVFYRSGDAYWDYQFLPTGRVFTTNNAQSILSVLRQKYFIFARDNGNEEIFFYYALVTPASVASLLPSIYHSGADYLEKRYFLARDENNSVRYAGTATDPIHNLGFIKSTESLPAYYSQRNPISFDYPINLEYEDGDTYSVDDGNFFVYPAQVVETFDTKKNPSLFLTISQLEYFSSTEGGALPSTIMAAAPYTPLDVSSFNGILDANDNNLQAAMQTIDDHTHAGLVTNGDSHDHSGGDGGQIDHASLANKGSATHAQIDSALAAIPSISSGAYTPTMYKDSNLTSLSAYQDFHYLQIGAHVIVTGAFLAKATAAGYCMGSFSLPISSNFTTSYDGNGNITITKGDVFYAGSAIADPTNDRGWLHFSLPDSANNFFCRFVLEYTIM
jgi:hypothetical protein